MSATTSPKAKAGVPERLDTFKAWTEAQKIPIVRGFFIEDIDKVELEPWDLVGVPGAIVLLDGAGGTNDAHVCEIPPAGSTKAIRHLYEEMVYITKGHGSTTVWQKDGKKHSFEWGPGSLFAIPINAYYRHFNGSGAEPVRYYAVTNCNFIMNLFHNVDFVFGTDFVFDDRFDPSNDDYFATGGRIETGCFMTTNFVPDVRTIALYDRGARGKGNMSVHFNLADQTMGAHISQLPPAMYKKGHRHGPGANVIILSGKGYSILWPEGQERIRVDWKPGSVVVPPDMWFHQHMNTGREPARYLALRWNNWRFKSIMKGENASSFTSIKDGGWQVPYEDEDPSIHGEFLEALAQSGAECQMCDDFPMCPKKHDRRSEPAESAT
jgi:oxalate decarboxylase/phosphoglucose isomerase-like protein (cupin superfamily)